MNKRIKKRSIAIFLLTFSFIFLMDVERTVFVDAEGQPVNDYEKLVQSQVFSSEAGNAYSASKSVNLMRSRVRLPNPPQGGEEGTGERSAMIIPEPSTLFLFGIGLLCIGLIKRKTVRKGSAISMKK